MRDRILEIRCDGAQDVLDGLSRLPGVREAALYGAGLHAVVEDAVAAEAAVRAELGRLGVAIHGIEEVLPSMEDVFVSLIEQFHRDSAAGEVSRA
jgi:ABC-2 type transport system ATP-binding protein